MTLPRTGSFALFTCPGRQCLQLVFNVIFIIIQILISNGYIIIIINSVRLVYISNLFRLPNWAIFGVGQERRDSK